MKLNYLHIFSSTRLCLLYKFTDPVTIIPHILMCRLLHLCYITIMELFNPQHNIKEPILICEGNSYKIRNTNIYLIKNGVNLVK